MLSVLPLRAVSIDGPVLSNAEKEEFAYRIKQKVDDFQTHLGIISSGKNSQKTRKTAVNECLKLFIGKGDDYYTHDEDGRELPNKAVTMQTTSKRRKTPRTQPMKQYLTTLSNNMNGVYDEVRITSSDAVRVDNIYETGDGKYECVAYFFQKFEGYRDGSLIYIDLTTKKVRVYLEQIEGPVGKTWSIALGDISAVETR